MLMNIVSYQQDQCFYELRTVQQLGYAVFCFKQVNEGIGSFEVSFATF